MRRIAAAIVVFGIGALIFVDAGFHFDSERVDLKRKYQSAQRHWSWFYKQQFVYDDGSFKYQKDIRNIAQIIDPGELLLADLSSSYYLAAELPIYVKNVHRHHYPDADWRQMLDDRYFCYIDYQESLELVVKFLDDQSKTRNDNHQDRLKYWLINQDRQNSNMRHDCLSARSSSIVKGLDRIGTQIYQGDYLLLYEIN